MNPPLLLLLTLALTLLTACATSTNGRVTDAGREIRSDNGYQTIQQTIRF
ncbi:MAG: hypothetical protein LBK60_08255 [Verrucomicrobiales bacterium]|jgi:outer membrane biogenesis lipoprotein LolB|nr:hypothetical protein [Verrucomicrobiales bacterium]